MFLVSSIKTCRWSCLFLGNKRETWDAVFHAGSECQEDPTCTICSLDTYRYIYMHTWPFWCPRILSFGNWWHKYRFCLSIILLYLIEINSKLFWMCNLSWRTMRIYLGAFKQSVACACCIFTLWQYTFFWFHQLSEHTFMKSYCAVIFCKLLSL